MYELTPAPLEFRQHIHLTTSWEFSSTPVVEFGQSTTSWGQRRVRQLWSGVVGCQCSNLNLPAVISSPPTLCLGAFNLPFSGAPARPLASAQIHPTPNPMAKSSKHARLNRVCSLPLQEQSTDLLRSKAPGPKSEGLEPKRTEPETQSQKKPQSRSLLP